MRVPSQLDGVSETTVEIPANSSNRTSRKRHLSTSCEHESIGMENRRSSPPTKPCIDKSKSDPSRSLENGSIESDHPSSKRRLSENNLASNHSTNGVHSNPSSTKHQKSREMSSSSDSHVDHEASSSWESTSHTTATLPTSSKPVREAKKRSLIYTGNTREFLETAIAAGLIADNGEEEDEDNEYVPPGGTANVRRRARLASSSSSSNDDEESVKRNSSSSDDEEEEEEEEEEEDNDNSDDEKNSGDEVVANEQPSESGVNWNVRNRPQRQTHLIRFDNISKQDGERYSVNLSDVRFTPCVF